VELFRERHPQTADVGDIKHKTASLLRHVLEADERWRDFNGRVGATKCQVQQTELAFLAPPSQRQKARYMNLAEVVRWGADTLRLLDRKSPEVLEHVTAERLEEKLGWLREFQAPLREWSELLGVANVAEDFVRRQGLYQGAMDDLEKCRPAELSTTTARRLWVDLLYFVRGQAAQARPGERLPGSTEALESCFGKLKQLEKDQNRSGFTGLVLGLGALVSQTTTEVVHKALNYCSVKKVASWCKQHLRQTVQAQRRAAYAAVPAETVPAQ
jgi:hypothetical protein